MPCHCDRSHRLSQNLVHLLLKLLVVSKIDESISETNEDGRDDEVVLWGTCSLIEER